MKATAILCVVFLTSATTPELQPNQWTATDNKDGINSYIGPTGTNGTMATKVTMTLPTSPEKAVRIIADVDNYSQWVPYCEKSFTIQKVSDTVCYAYQRISAPLVSDRDLAMRLTVRKIANKEYEILLTAVPNFVKAENNAIRIEHFIARYHVYAISKDSTCIEQVCEVNIGGSIPSFLLRWANHNQPHETFQKLRTQILNS